MASRRSTCLIQKTEENTGERAAVMKEKIDWNKEIFESRRFNNKFKKNLIEDGAKNFMQGIYLGYMYSRWRKIRALDKDDPVENKEQMKSFKEFKKKIK